jgi:hypothetical protein
MVSLKSSSFPGSAFLPSISSIALATCLARASGVR